MKRLFVIPFFLIIIFMGVNTSAISGGECEVINFPNSDPVNFVLVSNTTELNNFNWTKNNTLITYCFSIIQKSGDFTFKWFNEKAEKEVEEGGSSGGGGLLEPYIVPKEDIKKGYEKTLKTGRSFYFQIENEHKLTVKNTTKETATFLIESDPVEITLKEGGFRHTCISESEAVEIKNLHIVGDYAHFILKSIDASHCQAEPKEDEKYSQNESEGKDKKEQPKGNFPYMPFVAIIISIILLVIVIKKIQKRNSKNTYTAERGLNKYEKK